MSTSLGQLVILCLVFFFVLGYSSSFFKNFSNGVKRFKELVVNSDEKDKKKNKK